MAGFANLDLKSWFEPFNPPRYVHPYLGLGYEQPWETDHEHYEEGTVQRAAGSEDDE